MSLPIPCFFLPLGKWFRAPALRLFGTTRVALPKCDTLITANSPRDRWVHVMFREWSYRVAVYEGDGTRIPVSHLERSLSAVVEDVRVREARDEVCVPIGRLTADDRDLWASVRDFFPFISIGVYPSNPKA